MFYGNRALTLGIAGQVSWLSNVAQSPIYGMAKNLEVLVCATTSGSGSVRMCMDIACRSRRLTSLLSRFVFWAISSKVAWPPGGIMSRILNRTIESMLTTFETLRALVSGYLAELERSLPRQICKSASEVPREPHGAKQLHPTLNPEVGANSKGGMEGCSQPRMDFPVPGLPDLLAALPPRRLSLQPIRRSRGRRWLVPF